jgi:hypothetical protein
MRKNGVMAMARGLFSPKSGSRFQALLEHTLEDIDPVQLRAEAVEYALQSAPAKRSDPPRNTFNDSKGVR